MAEKAVLIALLQMVIVPNTVAGAVAEPKEPAVE